jgi:hypothetical protein
MSLTYAGTEGQIAYPDLVGNMDHIGEEGSLFNRTFPLALRDFARAVLDDVEPPITAKDGIRVLELEDAIVRSNDYNTTVVPYLNIKGSNRPIKRQPGSDKRRQGRRSEGVASQTSVARGAYKTVHGLM